MRKLYALVLVLIAAALGVGMGNAQTAPTVKAIQPGLVEVAGPRVIEAVAAGIQKLTATPGKGGQSIAVQSPWGEIYFDWPKDVKPMAFTIETGGTPAAMTATISAPGFTQANRADYKAAIEAVVPMAIKQAQAQKDRKTKGG
jgi:hypothetical protein